MTTTTIIFIILFAAWEAYEDHLDIKVGKRIDHKAGWKYRATVALIVELLIMYVAQAPFMQFLVCYALSAPLFSMVFRFCLNKWNRKDWRYLGPTEDRGKDDSWYDGVFIRLTYLVWNKAGRGAYSERTNRAGLLVYIFEATLAAILITVSVVMW